MFRVMYVSKGELFRNTWNENKMLLLLYTVQLTEGPEILWNESPDTGNPKYRSENWIPVKKKDY